ncbi:MAG TPA: hypothetical protein VFL86_11500 [Burkholderiaceae bacterium]|nr:hypothetical protein [Burkholderiaceae bacterium]
MAAGAGEAEACDSGDGRGAADPEAREGGNPMGAWLGWDKPPTRARDEDGAAAEDADTQAGCVPETPLCLLLLLLMADLE